MLNRYDLLNFWPKLTTVNRTPIFSQEYGSMDSRLADFFIPNYCFPEYEAAMGQHHCVPSF